MQNCTFEALNYGVKAGTLASGVGNDIENNTFNGNQRGVYVYSGYSLDIHKNTFILPQATNQDVYAVMTAGLNTFDIRENTISGSATISQNNHAAYGIIIEN